MNKIRKITATAITAIAIGALAPAVAAADTTGADGAPGGTTSTSEQGPRTSPRDSGGFVQLRGWLNDFMDRLQRR